ncbi:MAG: hypothetical protein COA82_10480 [Alkaliphilus sp.]|nr:DUF58 domain-containing protein [Alkaliphilus transvaalensis]PHS31117.1 MAG: hypothetical protein COA82_10480 [Alkaliphilus sp.]
MSINKKMLLIGVMLLIPAVIIGGRLPYYLLYFYLLTIIFSVLQVVIGAKFIIGKVSINKTEVMAGETVEIKYTISNNTVLSFPRLELQNEIAYRLSGDRPMATSFYLEPKSSYRNELRVFCNRRGLYEVGEIKLIIKDVFGICAYEKKITDSIYLKAYPAIIELKDLRIRAGQQFGGVKTKNVFFQDNTEIFDIREYQAEEPAKKINWKISAKYDKLLVRNYELRGDAQVIVIIDSCKSSYIDDRERLIEDKVVEIAISVIKYCLEMSIAVTLKYMNEDKNIEVKGSEETHIKEFMEKLTIFEPKSKTEFFESISKTALNAIQGATVMLISPAIDNEIGVSALRMKAKNLSPTVVSVGIENEFSRLQKENKHIVQRLKQEGVQAYYIEHKQNIRDVLEEVQ